jgi:polyphosphate kinase
MESLIEASKEGVKIELIVRGICCLIPGIINETENITVRSLIGRYLEHSRIYYFHRNGVKTYYISSADLMTRNMEKRIEIATPILDDQVKNECSFILNECLNDTVNSYVLNPDGNYTKIVSDEKNDMQKNLFKPLTSTSEAIISKTPVWQKYLDLIKSFYSSI